MTGCGDRIEQLLADVAAGRRSPDDPEVLALLSPGTELGELAAALDARGAEARAEFAAARAGLDDADRARARAFVDGLRATLPRRRRWPLVAAAALLAAAAVALWRPWAGGDAAPGDIVLGPAREAGLAPLGGGASFDEFSWQVAPVPGAYFRVRVFDGSDPTAVGGEVLLGDDVEASPWRPSERDRITLQSYPRIRWQLEIVDPDVGPSVVAEAIAWR